MGYLIYKVSIYLNSSFISKLNFFGKIKNKKSIAHLPFASFGNAIYLIVGFAPTNSNVIVNATTYKLYFLM